MKHLKIFILLIILIGVLFGLREIYRDIKTPSSTRAYGDLTVDFGLPPIPPSGPIFTFTDFKPGDCAVRNITINNDSDLKRLTAVKGIWTSGFSNDPYYLEKILTLVINSGQINNFQGTVSGFFQSSNSENGLALDLIDGNQSKAYTFTVCFPKDTGNEYQKLSVIFDLSFGIVTANHLVINEVYLWPDDKHGLDSDTCLKPGSKIKDCTKNDEWIEIFNPTDQPVSLKNWTIEDAKTKNIIHANKIIPPNSFAILVKDGSFKKYWSNLPKNTLIIELGQILGDGLNNTKDYLILKNPQGESIDNIGWGTGNPEEIVNLIIPTVINNSFERVAPGVDTDLPEDFVINTSPSPGY